MSPMLAAFRRFRTLSALLLALSPGVLGTVLPVVHPCPVDSPTMAGATGAAADAHEVAHAAPHGAAHATSHHGSGHSGDHAQHCHCPGTCSSSPAVSPTTFALTMLRLGAIAQPQAPPADRRLPGPPSHLLPPSTAPPASV
jgi:hypothetical protein